LPAPPVCTRAPATHQPVGPRGDSSHRCSLMSIIMQEVVGRGPQTRDPRGGARGPTASGARRAADARPSAFEEALGLKGRPHLLQVRGRCRPSGSHKPNTGPCRRRSTARRTAGKAHRGPRRGLGIGARRLRLRDAALTASSARSFMVGHSYRQKPVPADHGWRTFGASVPLESVRRHARRFAMRSRTSRSRSGVARTSRSPRPFERGRDRSEAAYSLGSVLNHVLMHQTGDRDRGPRKQLAALRREGPRRRHRPAAGGRLELRRHISFPFLRDKDRGRGDRGSRRRGRPRAQTLTARRPYAYDFGA